MESLDRKAILTAFPEGAPVLVMLGGDVREEALTGILSRWSHDMCAVELPPSRDPIAPPRGSAVVLAVSRLDGVYRLPGQVKDTEVEQVSELTSPESTLYIRAFLNKGQRVQQRSFFRLTGGWRAVILPAGKGDVVDEAEVIRAQVWNLSAGGMLLEDPRQTLSIGSTFWLILELDDEAEPLRVKARVVRRDERSSESSPQWGCCFENLSPEQERRIVQFLHEKIRARFMTRARRPRESA